MVTNVQVGRPMPSGGGSGSTFHTASFETPLQDIPEEGTPLRFSFPRDQCQQRLQSAGSSGGSRSSSGSGKPGSKAPSPAAAAKQAGQGDHGSPEPSGGKTWLSQRLQWPVVPIYSDVGTGWHLQHDLISKFLGCTTWASHFAGSLH